MKRQLKQWFALCQPNLDDFCNMVVALPEKLDHKLTLNEYKAMGFSHYVPKPNTEWYTWMSWAFLDSKDLISLATQKLNGLRGATGDHSITDDYKYAHWFTLSFTWDSTCEGHEYWRDIHTRNEDKKTMVSPNFTLYEHKEKEKHKPINYMESISVKMNVKGHRIIKDFQGKLVLFHNTVGYCNEDGDIVRLNKRRLDDYFPDGYVPVHDDDCDFAHPDNTKTCDYSSKIFLDTEDNWCWVDHENCWCHESEVHNYDIRFSDYISEWVNIGSGDVIYGYIDLMGNKDYMWTDNAVHNDCNDEYYCNEDVCESYGYYYDSNISEWRHDDDREDDEDDDNYCVRDYHHFSRVAMYGRDVPKFTVGFEVEKEDRDAKTGNDAQDIYDATKWCHERDGSLDSYSGYELVSPIFDLYDTKTLVDSINHKMIKPLIDAGYSDSCGGHINISSTEYTPDQLGNGFMGFMPLLYSIYENRINRDYSRAKVKHEYFVNKGKYSSMFIKGNLVELRIFPAVKNTDNLMWRVGLVRIMCENLYRSELDVLKMILNTRSRLYKHLALVFDDAKILDKANKFIKHSNIYNGTKLEMPKKNKNKTNNKK